MMHWGFYVSVAAFGVWCAGFQHTLDQIEIDRGGSTLLDRAFGYALVFFTWPVMLWFKDKGE